MSENLTFEELQAMFHKNPLVNPKDGKTVRRGMNPQLKLIELYGLPPKEEKKKNKKEEASVSKEEAVVESKKKKNKKQEEQEVVEEPKKKKNKKAEQVEEVALAVEEPKKSKKNKKQAEQEKIIEELVPVVEEPKKKRNKKQTEKAVEASKETEEPKKTKKNKKEAQREEDVPTVAAFEVTLVGDYEKNYTAQAQYEITKLLKVATVISDGASFSIKLDLDAQFIPHLPSIFGNISDDFECLIRCELSNKWATTIDNNIWFMSISEDNEENNANDDTIDESKVTFEDVLTLLTALQYHIMFKRANIDMSTNKNIILNRNKLDINDIDMYPVVVAYRAFDLEDLYH
jgi:hypothetical protein